MEGLIDQLNKHIIKGELELANALRRSIPLFYTDAECAKFGLRMSESAPYPYQSTSQKEKEPVFGARQITPGSRGLHTGLVCKTKEEWARLGQLQLRRCVINTGHSQLHVVSIVDGDGDFSSTIHFVDTVDTRALLGTTSAVATEHLGISQCCNYCSRVLSA